MSQVDLVGVVHIDKFWPAVRDGFERALLKTGGDLTTGDLWTQCRSGSAFLVIVHEGETIVASAIVRSEVWQTGNKLRVLALYGEGAGNWFEDIMNMGRRIAADCGATSIVFEGRLGWQKFFPKAKVLRALYEEEIVDGPGATPAGPVSDHWHESEDFNSEPISRSQS